MLYRVIVCIALASLGFYLIFKAYDNWKQNPVMTSVQTTALPIEAIEFPAITICALGSISILQLRAYKKQVFDFLVQEGVVKVGNGLCSN